MLHVVNLDLMSASARHHPDGSPKDAAEHHRRDHILRLRKARTARWVKRFARLWSGARRLHIAKPDVAYDASKGYEMVKGTC